jgi:pimeloyl-ACP methyl ester carboxylesterase
MTLVLVHSPVVGPRTWAPVGDALRARGQTVIVPDARPPDEGRGWSWGDFVDRVVESLELERDFVLVGHSGAGPLLPAIADRAAPRVTACVCVDAALPAPEGPTPIVPVELLPALESMATDGRVPRWSEWWPEEAMRSLVPDDEVRRQLTEEMPRLPLAYFRDSVPVPPGWARMPCAYLQFSAIYQSVAVDAGARGWRVVRIDGQHLHMVVDPDATASALLDLVAGLV